VGERTSHAPGTISWVDLATTDLEGAKAFYGGLFGWEAEDLAGPAGTYSLLRLGGAEVAGAFEQPADGGVPPHWNTYVTVADLDAGIARAKELGAAGLMGAHEIEGAGRMGVLADPTGAAFALWEPSGRIGAELVNAPGALCWNDLGTNDPAAAEQFYGKLFGWTLDDPVEGDPTEYRTIRNGESTNGSIHRQGEQEAGTPPNWLPYFATADLAGSTAQVSEAGGQVLVPPLDVPAGQVIVAVDPQGAAFGLFAGELDP
jgi:hypothetical protein